MKKVSLIWGVLFACQKCIENLDKWQVIIFRIRYGDLTLVNYTKFTFLKDRM